jgi:alginate production protein
MEAPVAAGQPAARSRGTRSSSAAVLLLLALFGPGPACLPARADRVFEPGAPPDTTYRLAPSLTFGAEVEFEFAFRRNLDLDRRTADDASLLEREFLLAWSYDPTPTLQVFVDLAFVRRIELAGLLEDGEGGAIEPKEVYVRVGPAAGGLSALIGRQGFADERKWLYDEELDAVRLRYGRGPWTVELSVSRDGLTRRDLLRDNDQARIDNYVLHAFYTPRESLALEGYVILRDNRDARRQRPVFLGVRAAGEPVEDLDYWLELAFAGGQRGRQTIRGWAIDAGATYEWQVGPKPGLTLGVAFGSGDRDRRDSLDGSFRQTGLQKNEGDFGGATDFKYYGEILDPELSNLLILTAGVGVRPSDRVSLDLVYHYYLQQQASSALRTERLAAEPSGRSRRLGSEVDLILGLAEILGRIEAKVVAGYFIPGAAFPGGSGAWAVTTELQYRF